MRSQRKRRVAGGRQGSACAGEGSRPPVALLAWPHVVGCTGVSTWRLAEGGVVSGLRPPAHCRRAAAGRALLVSPAWVLLSPKKADAIVRGAAFRAMLALRSGHGASPGAGLHRCDCKEEASVPGLCASKRFRGAGMRRGEETGPNACFATCHGRDLG